MMVIFSSPPLVLNMSTSTLLRLTLSWVSSSSPVECALSGASTLCSLTLMPESTKLIARPCSVVNWSRRLKFRVSLFPNIIIYLFRQLSAASSAVSTIYTGVPRKEFPFCFSLAKLPTQTSDDVPGTEQQESKLKSFTRKVLCTTHSSSSPFSSTDAVHNLWEEKRREC